MKRQRRLLVLLFLALLAFPAYGAQKKKIGKIYLTVDSNLGVSEEGSASASKMGENAVHYEIKEVDYPEGDEGFGRFGNPEIAVTLKVKDPEEYEFSGTSSKNFKILLSEASKTRYEAVEFVRAKLNKEEEELTLTVRLIFDKNVSRSGVSLPASLHWDSQKPGTARWNHAAGAKYYQIQLIRDGAWVGDPISIYGTQYNAAPLLTLPGEYRFLVRSVKEKTNAKGEWSRSPDVLTVEPGEGEEFHSGILGGSWQQAEDGIRWWWRNPDGSWPAEQWKFTGGAWYYFDGEGYLAEEK